MGQALLAPVSAMLKSSSTGAGCLTWYKLAAGLIFAGYSVLDLPCNRIHQHNCTTLRVQYVEDSLGHCVDKNHRHVAAIDVSVRTATFCLAVCLLSVLGTIYKLQPQTGDIDVTMELFQERNHKKKSIKMYFLFCHSECCSSCQWWAAIYYR